MKTSTKNNTRTAMKTLNLYNKATYTARELEDIAIKAAFLELGLDNKVHYTTSEVQALGAKAKKLIADVMYFARYCA